MKVSELIPGNKYNATCFNGNMCTFVEVFEEFPDGSALVSVEYQGRLYLASIHQLYIEN